MYLRYIGNKLPTVCWPMYSLWFINYISAKEPLAYRNHIMYAGILNKAQSTINRINFSTIFMIAQKLL